MAEGVDHRKVSRRAFLGAVGAVGAAVLAGCHSGTGHPHSTGTPSPGPATADGSSPAASGGPGPPAFGSATALSPAATSSAATGPPDFKALAASLRGPLVQPHDKAYRSASELFDPRFDGIHPQAVAQCASAGDVAECVRFARRSGVALAVRSGGHCYAGWSTGPGLVIDTGPLNTVRVGSGSAVIGAGARLIDVYAALAKAGVGIPGGSCPTVGIAGLTLGGGIGVVDRMWGLACDSLTAVDVVVADGTVTRCSASRDADLFWACRGGAGGTFGVATSFTFGTRPIAPLATWGLTFPWSRAAAVIDAWLRWVPTAPDEVWGSVHLSSEPDAATPSVAVVGTYFGADLPTLDRVLDGLVSAVGSEPASRYTGSHAFLDAMLIDAGCGGEPLAACQPQPSGTVARQAYSASSDWIDRPLPSAGTATLLHAIGQRHDTAGAPDVAVELDASGGAINRVAPAASAFVHRTAICSVQYIANWYPDTPAAMVRSASAWPHRTRLAMAPYVTGEAYQNYVDDQIVDWQLAYFGANYPRLQQIKASYDPDNLFHHRQSVTA